MQGKEIDLANKTVLIKNLLKHSAPIKSGRI